jgi:hypothetical protein
VCRTSDPSFCKCTFEHVRLLCGAGGYLPNVLQSFEIYCTNPALVSPFHLQRRSTSTGVRDLYQRQEELWARKCPIKFSHTIATSTVIVGFFYMPQSCDMGPTALLPLLRKACWGFFRPKNQTAGFEPANLGIRGQHANQKTNEAAMNMFLSLINSELRMSHLSNLTLPNYYFVLCLLKTLPKFCHFLHWNFHSLIHVIV